MKNRFTPEKSIADTKVVVAMSGGVDSSVAAAMLHHEGYQVIGLTMQLYDHGLALAKKGACCAGKDIYDAKMVAERLGFPHYVLNYENVFKQEVMDDFVETYLRGETPIPCVRCNQSVKFRDLYKMAKDLEAEALVTGHYVQRLQGAEKVELHRAADPFKDQSYFLFATTQEQLNYVHFPLGGMDKTQTRALAREFGLEIADKPDSQDICFVPDGSYAKVIEKLHPGAAEEGDIVHMDGRILGKHQGIIHYTRGQRRGLGIAGAEAVYVVALDAINNRVIVGPEEALGSKEVLIKQVNWLGDKPLTDYTDGVAVEVKLRSASRLVSAKIYPSLDQSGDAKIILHQPERAVTKGQACVIYDQNRVLGGGWITETK